MQLGMRLILLAQNGPYLRRADGKLPHVVYLSSKWT